MPNIELDFCPTDEVTEASTLSQARDSFKGLEVELVTLRNAGNGWPIVRVTGEREALEQAVRAFEGPNGDPEYMVTLIDD